MSDYTPSVTSSDIDTLLEIDSYEGADDIEVPYDEIKDNIRKYGREEVAAAYISAVGAMKTAVLDAKSRALDAIVAAETSLMLAAEDTKIRELESDALKETALADIEATRYAAELELEGIQLQTEAQIEEAELEAETYGQAAINSSEAEILEAEASKTSAEGDKAKDEARAASYASGTTSSYWFG